MSAEVTFCLSRQVESCCEWYTPKIIGLCREHSDDVDMIVHEISEIEITRAGKLELDDIWMAHLMLELSFKGI